MRFSLVIWSFVASFCLYNALTIDSKWICIFLLTGFFISLYLWIYALIYIIKTDFPLQIKIKLNDLKEGE